MEQTLVCKKCGKECGTRQSQLKCRKTHILVKSCEACRQAVKERLRIMLSERNKSQKMRDLSSTRMKRNNPMYNQDVVKKVVETNKAAYETGQRKSSFCNPETKSKAEEGTRRFWKSEKSQGLKKRFKKRMSRLNPMFDPKIVTKVMGKLAEGRKSGRIVQLKGKSHWLWKGNRSFNLVIRSRLYKTWTIPIVVKDGFACKLCGRDQCSLQVHHLRPLALIIKTVLDKEGVLDVERLVGTTRYSELADMVVAEHRLEDGITVCRKCHASIDRQYRGHEKLNQNCLSKRMKVIKKRESQ